ncbi:carboxymuconolactone decarboxylase family protein [Taibaiella chishuiensis]|uniref:Alkyl hydroperoxide reductase AhpD n=1 Tax=Taibaiella chishuiensis TaxID=1434707 RepID=A0A2P8D9I9_9BACT|nr:carboxymuconolactone decarboxylase family protein [Taibaiella chishuiensis]PSK93886.1 alkyl hydroperoxide reductase subunit D [Taibaiella chishuiensis]
MNETIQNLFADLKIPADYKSEGLEKLAAADNRFLKDLKLNIGAVLKSNNINKKEAFLLALSVAANEKSAVLIQAFETLARGEEATDAELAEIHACTALMNTNNVFYRFRHYLPQNQYYNNTPAGLRMSIMMNPVLGKELFELTSLVVSALNGCELCVTSHEASVKQHGASEARIYDAIRLGAVIKSLAVIL